MAPTITSAMTISKDHVPLSNKMRKPVVEKMRRDRINNSIEQLKTILSAEFLHQQPDSKLEKADILEMTVSFLRRQQLQKQHAFSTTSAAVNQGFSRCVHEIVKFLSKDEVKTQSQKKLLNHFQNLQPLSDKGKRENVLSQLKCQDRETISNKGNSVKSSLWRPW